MKSSSQTPHGCDIQLDPLTMILINCGNHRFAELRIKAYKTKRIILRGLVLGKSLRKVVL